MGFGLEGQSSPVPMRETVELGLIRYADTVYAVNTKVRKTERRIEKEITTARIAHCRTTGLRSVGTHWVHYHLS